MRRQRVIQKRRHDLVYPDAVEPRAPAKPGGGVAFAVFRNEAPSRGRHHHVASRGGSDQAGALRERPTVARGSRGGVHRACFRYVAPRNRVAMHEHVPVRATQHAFDERVFRFRFFKFRLQTVGTSRAPETVSVAVALPQRTQTRRTDAHLGNVPEPHRGGDRDCYRQRRALVQLEVSGGFEIVVRRNVAVVVGSVERCRVGDVLRTALPVRLVPRQRRARLAESGPAFRHKYAVHRTRTVVHRPPLFAAEVLRDLRLPPHPIRDSRKKRTRALAKRRHFTRPPSVTPPGIRVVVTAHRPPEPVHRAGLFSPVFCRRRRGDAAVVP
mmetsp:Transcript_9912/g.32771  ORF Transcript_9912/g.32771 Transcript_9912/m.32771 type:complete len:326 (+) Transcript_9912:6930-7907(+)